MKRSAANASKSSTKKACVVNADASGSLRALKKKGKARASFKLAFKSPLAPRTHCPAIGEPDTKAVLDILKEHLNAYRLIVRKAKKSTVESRTDGDVRKHVFVGINSLAKGLEEGRVRVVIVCAEVSPALLTDHLYIQAQLSGARLCALSCSSDRLGAVVGCRTAIAIGFDEHMKELLEAISDHAKVPCLPWLNKHSTSLLPLEIETQLPNPNRSTAH